MTLWLDMNARRCSAALLMCVCACLAGATSAQDSWLDDEPEFLPVDVAFVLSADVGLDGALVANWQMPDGYYLYRHQFAFDTRTSANNADSPVVLGAAEIPPGKRKVDEWFGEVEVYYHSAQARVPVASGSGAVEVGISYQGCADQGLCYPPQTRWVAMDLSGPAGAVVWATTSDTSAPPVITTSEQELAGVLEQSSLLTALLLFFLGGVGLAFTPCVLPMVPILSSIIVGESDNITRSRAISLSLSYVLGMALTYAAIGTLVGLFGASLNLQAALQSAPVLIVFAVVFVVLSFSMFGFYELQLPQSWQNRLNAVGDEVSGGKFASVFVMGALSSLVVSPCVSAPLAGALIYISSTQDALLGGAALLALGLGMGLPLLVIGASGGHLLPKAGAWMNVVKAVFGVGLLAVAVWLLERVVPASVTLLLWAALAIGSGVYMGALDFSARRGWGQLWRATGAVSFIYGVLLLIGAASGAVDPLRPLQQFAGSGGVGSVEVQAEELHWRPVNNLTDVALALDQARAEGRPAMLDLYADWCISCKVMERSVFPRPDVAGKLAQFNLLRADITDNNDDHQALLQHFGLFGPPSLLFFMQDGSELADVRIQGDIDAKALSAHLGAILDFSEDLKIVENTINFR